ncbi:hypothetical protein AB832_07620 [Flavobacteriaceae bacterium (ex Bugula neritina AB1)]|nr:hypothetical protein AB832_07620 [Flavobacteriaceae bacterium (ex Bugula neritina AB1)]
MQKYVLNKDNVDVLQSFNTTHSYIALMFLGNMSKGSEKEAELFNDTLNEIANLESIKNELYEDFKDDFIADFHTKNEDEEDEEGEELSEEELKEDFFNNHYDDYCSDCKDNIYINYIELFTRNINYMTCNLQINSEISIHHIEGIITQINILIEILNIIDNIDHHLNHPISLIVDIALQDCYQYIRNLRYLIEDLKPTIEQVV